MAQKKISDLQLIASITDTVMLAVDNGIQSYRATALQIKNHVLSNGVIQAIMMGSNSVGTAAIIDANVTRAKLAQGAIARANASSKTSSYTLVDDDDILNGDATSGALTFTLPPVSGRTGKRYTIRKTDSSTNAVIIDGDGSEQVEGAANYELLNAGELVTVLCTGTDWIIVEKKLRKEIVALDTSTSTWTQTGGGWALVPHSVTTDSTRFPISSNGITIRRAGRYSLRLSQAITGANGENIRLGYTINAGSQVAYGGTFFNDNNGSGSNNFFSKEYQVTLAKGDVIKQYAIISSTSRTGQAGLLILEELDV